MRELKFALLVCVVVGVCVGCYFITETRHDYDLRNENAELVKKLDAKDALQQEIAAKTVEANKLFLDAISVRWPENSEEYDKMYKTVEEKLAKEEKAKEEEAKAEKIED